MHPALFIDDHEPAEHGQREVRSSGRRLHAGPHLHPYQSERPESALNGPVHQEFLREAPQRRGAVLVDAVCVRNRVH